MDENVAKRVSQLANMIDWSVADIFCHFAKKSLTEIVADLIVVLINSARSSKLQCLDVNKVVQCGYVILC